MMLGVIDRSSSAKSMIWIKPKKNTARPSCREACGVKARNQNVEIPNALESKGTGDDCGRSLSATSMLFANMW
jgi:hypothetical protein